MNGILFGFRESRCFDQNSILLINISADKAQGRLRESKKNKQKKCHQLRVVREGVVKMEWDVGEEELAMN